MGRRLQAPRIWDVVEEHLDDAAFLLDQWENALVSAVELARDVAVHLEPRIRGNLDGLHLACPEAVERLLLPALRSAERGRVTAAALVLAERPGGVPHLVEALQGAPPRAAGAIARALGLADRPELDGELIALLGHREPPVVAAALEALAFRRVDPGPRLLDLLRARDPVTLPAALRACRATRQDVRGAVEVGGASPRPAVRDAAITTGLRCGFLVAYTACERLLKVNAAAPALLYQVLAMSGDPVTVATIEAGLEAPPTRDDALRALGIAGWPDAVESILTWADDPAMAPLAGEAFAAITGVAIEGPFLAPESSAAEPPSLEEDDLDADLGTRPEGALPVPVADALRAWWEVHSARFDRARRYLDGAPCTPERLHQLFLGASGRRRHPLGLELAIRTRGGWDVEVRGWAGAQLAAEGRAPRFGPEAKLPFQRLLQG